MLRAIEYTLLAVSLLVVIGLIAGGSHDRSDSSAEPASKHPGESGEAPTANKPS